MRYLSQNGGEMYFGVESGAVVPVLTDIDSAPAVSASLPAPAAFAPLGGGGGWLGVQGVRQGWFRCHGVKPAITCALHEPTGRTRPTNPDTPTTTTQAGKPEDAKRYTRILSAVSFA